jgi:glutaredoxin
VSPRAILATLATFAVLTLWIADVRAATRVEVYCKSGCPHCAAGKDYLGELSRKYDLEIVDYDVVESGQARARLRALAAKAEVERLVVPSFVIRGQLVVGFDRGGQSAARIEALISGEAIDDSKVDLPLWGRVDTNQMGLPLFTIVVGFVDGFNPCAMWVLLFLLSILVNFHDRKKMAVVGGTFVVISGLAYFAFMAAWLNIFLIAGVSRPLQIGLGLVAVAVGGIHVKDFFAFGKGLSLSIPDAAKPGIYARVRRVMQAEKLSTAVGAVAVLAVVVNLIELVCTAGLPAVYTQVLVNNGVEGAGYYAYLALYILVYMLDDAAMLTIAIITLSKRKLQERGGRILKLVSGAVLLVLGLLLVFKPDWLLWG